MSYLAFFYIFDFVQRFSRIKIITQKHLGKCDHRIILTSMDIPTCQTKEIKQKFPCVKSEIKCRWIATKYRYDVFKRVEYLNYLNYQRHQDDRPRLSKKQVSEARDPRRSKYACLMIQTKSFMHLKRN